MKGSVIPKEISIVLKTWRPPCDLGQARVLEWCDLMAPGTGEDEERWETTRGWWECKMGQPQRTES